MNGIENINNLGRNFGLAADNMGINQRDMADPNKTFSHFFENAVKQQDEAKAGAESTPRIIPLKTHIDKTDKLYEQCLALETFLVKSLLTAMRNNVMKSSLIDTGFAGEIYEDMLWDEYAKEYTKNAGFGLADLAYLELTGQRGRKV